MTNANNVHHAGGPPLDDLPRGRHIAVACRPGPLQVRTKIKSGDDWGAALVVPVLGAVGDMFGIRQSWPVEFFEHEGPDDAECAECAQLMSKTTIARVRGPRKRAVANQCAPDYEPRPWLGPSGQISWSSCDLVLAAVVEDDEEGEECDCKDDEAWAMALKNAAITVAFVLLEQANESQLEFEAL